MIQLLALLLTMSFAAPVPVISAAGQVGADVVTSRRVKISTFLDRHSLLPVEKRGGVSGAEINAWSLADGSEEFKSQLSALMLEMMVAAESESFESTQKARGDFRVQAEKTMKELAPSSAWRKLEVELSEVESLLLVKERAKQFLRVKMESVDARISEEEVRSYYQRQRGKLGGLAYEDVKGMIRERLTQEAQIERLKDWFEVLKRKYRVQFFGSAGK